MSSFMSSFGNMYLQDFLRTYGPKLAEEQRLRDESLSRRRVLSMIDAEYHLHDCSVDDVLRLLQLLYVISLEHNECKYSLNLFNS